MNDNKNKEEEIKYKTMYFPNGNILLGGIGDHILLADGTSVTEEEFNTNPKYEEYHKPLPMPTDKDIKRIKVAILHGLQLRHLFRCEQATSSSIYKCSRCKEIGGNWLNE